MACDSRKLRPYSLAHVLLPAFLAVALLLRVGVAMRFPNVHHPDEIFQTQEPAHRLAYGYGVVSWEWRQGVRSWIFPTFLAGVMLATSWMGAGSAGYLWGIAAVLSLISLSTIWFGFAWAKRASGMDAAVIAAGGCAIWFGLIYAAPKALTEVVAAHVLLPGLYLGMYAEGLQERRRIFLAGLFCGLAVSFRIQLVPAVVFAAVYFCHPSWRRRLPYMLAGLLLPVMAFGLVDAITWSYPFHSFFLYFWVNVVEGRSLEYGARPWYWYLVMLVKQLGPIVCLALAGARRSPFLAWVALIILASHSVLAHKEVRFLYPLVPIVITLAALGLVEIAAAFQDYLRSPLSSRAIIITTLALFTLTSGFMAWRFTGWTQDSGVLIITDRLSRDSNLCGVGISGIRWANLGGYTHLHRNVPIVLVPQDTRLEDIAPSFNVLLTSRTLAGPQKDFKLTECWNGVCLYRRPGLCMPPPQDSEINTLLRQTGQ